MLIGWQWNQTKLKYRSLKGTQVRWPRAEGQVTPGRGQLSVWLSLDESGEHGEGSNWFVRWDHVTRTLQEDREAKVKGQQQSSNLPCVSVPTPNTLTVLSHNPLLSGTCVTLRGSCYTYWKESMRVGKHHWWQTTRKGEEQQSPAPKTHKYDMTGSLRVSWWWRCLPWQWGRRCCQTLWRSRRPADRRRHRTATDASEPPPETHRGQYTWGRGLKTCYLDHPDPQNKTSLFSVKAPNDLTDFVWVFQNTGRLNHSDPNLLGEGFPNLDSAPGSEQEIIGEFKITQHCTGLPKSWCMLVKLCHVTWT